MILIIAAMARVTRAPAHRLLAGPAASWRRTWCDSRDPQTEDPNVGNAGV